MPTSPMRFARRFLRDDSGATAIEYGLIAALVVVVSLTALMMMSQKTKAMWDGIAAAFAQAVSGG